jgi:hypothetical protein
MEENINMSQKQMPFILSEYRVWVNETTGGYIVIKAEDEDTARDKIDDLLMQYGLEAILYPEDHGGDSEEKELLCNAIKEANIQGGKQTLGEREVDSVEEILR